MHHLGTEGPDRTRPMGASPTMKRPEVVRVVREQIRNGLYRPPLDDVVEQLVAWLFLPVASRDAAGERL